MDTDRFPQPRPDERDARRVLVVADWGLAPEAITSVVRRHDAHRRRSVELVVPAWLHGVDWVGDPTASVPCAERQLRTLEHRCRAAGLDVEHAAVGDPDPVAATWDAVAEWGADEILLFPPERRLVAPGPLSLARRIGRATGLSVSPVVVAGEKAATRRRWLPDGGHCATPQAQAV